MSRRPRKYSPFVTRMIPLAAELLALNTEGVTVSDLRVYAIQKRVPLPQDHDALSALGHAFRLAGGFNNDERRSSTIKESKGIRQRVWYPSPYANE